MGLVMIAAVTAGTVLAVTLSEKPTIPMVPSTTFITENDNGSTIPLKKGDTVNLTVHDYGDGGYIWVLTNVNSTMLRQDRFFTWGSTGMLGDFGKDTWTFTALNSGDTMLSLECKRCFGEQDICETLVVHLKIT
jgi:predicted secreted protein